MKIKYLLLTLSIMVCCLLTAQTDDLRQRFERDLKTKNQEITSISCDFTQTIKMAVLANEVKKDGKFYFIYPDNILIAFNSGDYIKITEEQFEMKTAGNVSSTKVSSNPMLKNLKSILSTCIGGDFDQMLKNFDAEIVESKGEWQTTLTPKRSKSASKITSIVIAFDKKDMSLNKLEMVEKSGNTTTYAFKNKQFNTQIDKF